MDLKIIIIINTMRNDDMKYKLYMCLYTKYIVYIFYFIHIKH